MYLLECGMPMSQEGAKCRYLNSKTHGKNQFRNGSRNDPCAGPVHMKSRIEPSTLIILLGTVSTIITIKTDVYRVLYYNLLATSTQHSWCT